MSGVNVTQGDCQVSFHYSQHFYRGEILLSITEENDVSIASIHRLTKIHTFIALLIQNEILSSVRKGNMIGFMDLGRDMNYYNRRFRCQVMYTESNHYAHSNKRLRIVHVYGHVETGPVSPGVSPQALL